MARPKTKVERDRPEVIAVRERMKPVDQTIVLAKMNDGSLVEVRSHKGPLHKDGFPVRQPNGSVVLTYFHPWPEAVSYDILKKLKNGGAEQYAFKWGNSHGRMIAMNHGRRWQEVKVSENLVHCPYAYGDMTDGFVHNVDTILMKRDREYHEQIKAEEALMNSTEALLQRSSTEIEDTLGSMGVKDVVQTFEPSEKDAVTVNVGDD